MSEWRDISTAPHDGTDILIGHEVWYDDEIPGCWRDGAWRINGAGWANQRVYPSRWKPSPPEPNP